MKATRILMLLVVAMVMAKNASGDLPSGWYEVDIGQPAQPGSASYDESSETYSVTGKYECPHFVYKSLKGDGRITARIVSLSNDPVASYDNEGGVTIREDLTVSSKYAMVSSSERKSTSGTGHGATSIISRGVYFSYTSVTQDESISLPYQEITPIWIRLERKGNTFTAYTSENGINWSNGVSAEIPMSTNVWIGLIAWPGNYADNISTTAVFEKVDIDDDNGTGTGGGFELPYSGSISTSGNAFSITNTGSGIGFFAKGGSSGYAAEFRGRVRIRARNSGSTVVELGEGLDYAEGFDVSDKGRLAPGTVVIIDPANPGKLAISQKAYDRKVAGIVAGAKGLGSGVRLGTGQFDCNVALAGRVYCNVDATAAAVEPGDLLTTSEMPGFAAKVVDYNRAQGAILGKAMEKLQKGNKGQILVLVTLQ